MPRVNSLPAKTFDVLFHLLCDALQLHGITPMDRRVVSYPQPFGYSCVFRNRSRERITDVFSEIAWILQDQNQSVGASMRRHMLDLLWGLNIPVPNVMHDILVQIEPDYIDMASDRRAYEDRQKRSPIHTRLVVHSRQRHEKGPLEQIQLWKKLPVDTLVTLVGSFVSAQVTQKRGLKRRYSHACIHTAVSV